MTNAWPASKPMSLANVIMLCLGIAAFIGGAILLLRRGGSEAGAYVRRITGTMLGALGLVLMIFAVGLSTIRSVPNA
jgi:hypothetical protein